MGGPGAHQSNSGDAPISLAPIGKSREISVVRVSQSFVTEKFFIGGGECALEHGDSCME